MISKRVMVIICRRNSNNYSLCEIPENLTIEIRTTTTITTITTTTTTGSSLKFRSHRPTCGPKLWCGRPPKFPPQHEYWRGTSWGHPAETFATPAQEDPQMEELERKAAFSSRSSCHVAMDQVVLCILLNCWSQVTQAIWSRYLPINIPSYN